MLDNTLDVEHRACLSSARKTRKAVSGSLTRTMPCPIEPKSGFTIDVPHLANGCHGVIEAFADDRLGVSSPASRSNADV